MTMKTYTQEEIRQRVASSREWAEAALVAISQDGGFSLLDGALSDMAGQLKEGQRKHLSDKQLAVVQRALSRRYVDRLERIAQRKSRVRMVSEGAYLSTIG